jgi:ABC-type glycerol-3-phosphate transport system substrate-binding protein
VKPFLTLLLLLAALALAGCARTRADATRGKVRLKVWSMWGGDEARVFEDVVAYYNKSHPRVFLDNLSSVGDDKSVRAIVAGAPPDLLTLREPAFLGAMAANDALLPLDDRFRQAGLQEAAYTHGALSQARYNGRLYAIPYLLDCQVLLYNKDVFRAAGLDPEQPPRTLEELERDCRRITQRGPDGRLKRIGLRPPDAVMLLAIFGGGFLDAKTGQVTADNARNVEAAACYKRLMDAQGGNEAVEAFSQGFANDMGNYNPFFLGQVGMIFGGQWNTYWVYRYHPSTHYGVAPLPYPERHPERVGTAWLGGNLFCIPKEAQHVPEAWEFLVWTQTPEAQRMFAQTMHGVPNIRASLRDRSLREGEPWRPYFGRFMDLADSPNATHFPPMPVATLYLNEITTALDAVRYGRRSPAAALASVRVRVQRELEKYQ